MIGETLNQRYSIVSLLGSGLYGKTYLAEDSQAKEDSDSRRIIKEFEPKAKDTLSLRKAKYLFAREIKILNILGRSDRIPNLLGHFREGNKFYLVHQFIDGTDLGTELGRGKTWNAERVVELLKEILEIVEVAHKERVIHQDIKPSNIIRRKSDGRLMLVDFGSVKKLNNQMANAEGKTQLTVPIGTEGYIAPEQKSIKPRLASDIYGVGMIGIYALTGVEPKDIPLEHNTEMVQWHSLISTDETLTKVLDRMIAPDFRQRYTSASEALKTVRTFGLGKKLLDFKTIIGAGILLLGISGAGYYYWQIETSLDKMPNIAGYYETEKNEFPFLYRNAKYGIEMKYPFDWRVYEPIGNKAEIAKFFPQNSQSYLIAPEVQIQIAASNGKILDKHITNAVYQITQLPQAKIIDSRPIKFGQRDGHKVVYTAANPDNNIEEKFLKIWTIRGDRIYTVVYKAKSDLYDDFVDLVENEMLASLKITPAQ